jgi:hypothetical protein
VHLNASSWRRTSPFTIQSTTNPAGARTAQQKPTPEDSSPTATPAEAKRIQEIVGVSALVLCTSARCYFPHRRRQGSVRPVKAHPRAVLTAAERLLQYGDASYLSETKARSRGAGVFFLGDKNQPEILNAPLHCYSTILDVVVVAAATEAEYGAAYLNTRQIAPLIRTVEELGHPQSHTLLFIDNKAAAGIANDTVTQRHSKAMNMRYNLVRDRVRQGQLRVTWAPGNQKLADYLTKAHPTKHFMAMRPFFVTTPPSDAQWTTVGRDASTGAHSRKLCRRLTIADLPDPRPPSYAQRGQA